MPSGTLALAGLIGAVTAASFFAVGGTLRRRTHATGSAVGAARAFVAWWWCVGAYMAIQAALALLVAADVGVFPLWLAALYLTGPLLAAGLWGLTYYIAYLYLGKPAAALPLALVFVVAAAWYDWTHFAHRPLAVHAGTWLVEGTFADRPAGPAYTAMLSLFALPPIVASVAYLSLLPRVEGRMQRFRLVLVSASIIAWLGTGLAARLGTNDFLKFVNLSVFGLGTAALILVAYHPPRFVRAAFALDAEAVETRRSERRLRSAQLAARCRELL